MSLTSEEEELFEYVGKYAISSATAAVCESAFWAIYLVLFSFAMRIQIKRGFRRPGSIIMLVISIWLFASSTALWTMNVSSGFLLLNDFFLKHPGSTIKERVGKLDTDTMVLWFPEEALFLFNMIIGDAVVIWRAWVICGGSRLRKVVIVPMIMLSASFAWVVVTLDCLGTDGAGTQSTIPLGSRTCQWGEGISWGISLLTNITSTSIIALKTWYHRRSLRAGIPGPNRLIKSRSERTLLLLVESGFIYCLFWLSQIILFFPTPRGTFGHDLYLFLATLGDQISGIYPTVIIILVNMQRSVSDDTTLVGIKSIDITGSSSVQVQSRGIAMNEIPYEVHTKTNDDFV